MNPARRTDSSATAAEGASGRVKTLLFLEGSQHASIDLAWRVLALANLFRLIAPLVLGALYLGLQPSTIGQVSPRLFVAAAVTYFSFALLAIPGIKRRRPQVALQAIVNVFVDVLAISLMTYASGGVSSGVGALLVLPIGAASFVVRTRLALLFAAVAAIAVLVQQALVSLELLGKAEDFTAAGVIGALLFIVALVVGPLAQNLKESEERVRQREVDVANLAELNQFIVQHLRESILVVDHRNSIRLINDSAAQLLQGGAVPQGAPLGEVSPRLLYLLETWRRNRDDWQQSSLSLVTADGGGMLQPHFVALGAHEHGPTLIFLEDTSALIARVQQSKLASLGRLSASIAHEIRNPVGAMSHAAQLLGEAPTLTPQEKRLTDIIRTNGDRVSTIIENVLKMSRRDSTRQERIELNVWVREFLQEFRQTMQVDEQALRFAPVDAEVDVRVDPSHLHQLLWNLCENALKHGHKVDAPADVEIRTGRISTSDRPYLEVLDRGPGIDAHEAERIFEPFYTSGEGGTGLGLFIARELAQSNRALLVHESRSGGGSIFRVVFADPQRWRAQEWKASD